MVMEVVHEDIGDGSMHCTNHPYKNSAPSGGICAFCLQEKLGKLVSSSFPIAVFPSSSSSPSPSFRSDFDTTAAAPAASQNRATTNEICHYARRSSRLPFVLTHRRKKKNHTTTTTTNNNGVSETGSIVFKRSKSTVTPRQSTLHFMDESFDNNRRGFWSFLYAKHRKSGRNLKDLSFAPATPTVISSSSAAAGPARSRAAQNESPDDGGGLDRKVSRSRSVGCGSRSFSGDFFERISTGFGDCTLRRVESQREGKSKVQPSMQRQECMKERVRCGGIFSGLMITSSSSSSSSLVSEENHNNNNNNNNNNNGKSSSSAVHGRSRSWGWALASPMRAFSNKPLSSSSSSSTSGKRGSAKQVTTPNLAAIPSLLAVSG